jgi:hypothetical protein
MVQRKGLEYALACGLPVIATPNTGAADIVREGREGFIVPMRDIESLASCLEWGVYASRGVARNAVCCPQTRRKVLLVCFSKRGCGDPGHDRETRPYGGRTVH